MRRERRGKSSNGKDINVPEQGAELVTIQMTGELSITRVVNACVLLQLDEDAVLTDPYFAKHWFIRLRESIGLDVAALPRLTVILGGHGVFDHWQPASLVGYTHKSDTPVIVSTHAMRRAAVAAGFTRAKVLEWGATRRLSSRLEVEVAPAQAAAGMRVNNYVLQHRGLRVFIGTEARDLDPLRRYRAERPPVDIALLPIDASAALGHKLVMGPDDALEGAQILGARILIPIHYALKPVPLLLRTPGSCAQLVRLARGTNQVEVIPLETGRRWTCQWEAPENSIAGSHQSTGSALDRQTRATITQVVHHR